MITVTHDTFPLGPSLHHLARVKDRGAGADRQASRAAGVTGWGECVPYARYGESLESVTAQIAKPAWTMSAATALQGLLPAGAARNAVDCALWDS